MMHSLYSNFQSIFCKIIVHHINNFIIFNVAVNIKLYFELQFSEYYTAKMGPNFLFESANCFSSWKINGLSIILFASLIR